MVEMVVPDWFLLFLAHQFNMLVVAVGLCTHQVLPELVVAGVAEMAMRLHQPQELQTRAGAEAEGGVMLLVEVAQQAVPVS
jgi:hypothetical protein